ncbi:hypothetical protein [Arthrobacter woluwensis]|uniref:hypothetical protein n=1 Tax=Arthrobacter woluwensis TaxID=156980 RepID=UPI003813D8B4
MTMPSIFPQATFTGAYGDTATNSWYPAQAVLEQGIVTLWVGSPTGWMQYFSVPAAEVTVKSAAQRITLAVAGRNYPILADPRAVYQALNFGAANVVGEITGNQTLGAMSTAGRAMNQVGAAQAFNAGGGNEFLAAMRASGARVSRLGYGAIAAIGCGAGLLVVILVVVITVWTLNL